MKRIYVAGRYSADNVITALENIRRGIRAAAELIMQGNAVFCPWIDHSYWLTLKEGEEITLEQIQAQSLNWLAVCDEMYVLKGWENSRGTLLEMEYAKSHNIPIRFQP